MDFDLVLRRPIETARLTGQMPHPTAASLVILKRVVADISGFCFVVVLALFSIFYLPFFLRPPLTRLFLTTY